ncbi:DUF2851 family protein [soil metagenome]
MQENFLYYLWQKRLFQNEDLRTAEGEIIEILHPGYRNDDSGPDFFNARIRIGNVMWAGNVEIHVRSSDWKKHKHDDDDAFNTVVLHVVHENDCMIYRKDGTIMPVLKLKGLYDTHIFNHYTDLIQGVSTWVPCENQITDVPPIHQQQWFSRMLAERLEERSREIALLLKQTNNNWEESFYRHLAKSFGFRVNNLPFEMLASSLPHSAVSKHRDNLMQMEALFFGQAGFLEGKMKDLYTKSLQKEFSHLRLKFNLRPMMTHLWKFGRLRPSNFPTIRIAQFAMLYHLHERLFDKMVNAADFGDLNRILDLSPGKYWDTHYSFNSKSENLPKKPGKGSVESLMINTIAPFIFYYGIYHQLPEHCAKALRWLELCSPEDNHISRGWKKAGIAIHDAGNSQAVLHLKKVYCDYKKCVNCGIGQYLLQHT